MNETYSVKQISKMLNVSEEQVKRWIRNGSLVGELESKKQGYRVKRSDLEDFIWRHPKYKLLIPQTSNERTSDRLEVSLCSLRRTIAMLEAECNLIQNTIDILKNEES